MNRDTTLKLMESALEILGAVIGGAFFIFWGSVFLGLLIHLVKFAWSAF